MKRNLSKTDSACVIIGLAFLVLFSTPVLAVEAGVAPISGMQITPPEKAKPESAEAVSSKASAGLLPIPDYSATIWKREQLTGDWGGVRTYLANKGVQIGVEGDAAADALRLADQTLAGTGSGSILWITDSIAPEQAASLVAWRKSSNTPVRLLPPLLPGPELDALLSRAKSMNASVVRLAADDADVTTLARAAKFATAATAEKSNRWAESGYWLTPVLAALILPFFRKGWMIGNAVRR